MIFANMIMGDPVAGSPVVMSLPLCVQRQAGAVRMFLRFFRFGFLALQ
jgi:hypothetical protein